MKNTSSTKNRNLAWLGQNHYNGLLIVGKIRKAIRNGLTNARITNFIVLEFESQLRPHLLEEEDWLLPQLPAESALRIQAEKQHAELRRMVKSFCDSPDQPACLPEDFANTLEEHIVFEERVLFPFIEKLKQEQALK